jgi:hypothetical protein
MDCSRCGSSNFQVDDFQPKDFPRRFYFMHCGECGNDLGMVDFCTVQDSFRRNDEVGKKLADTLLADHSAEVA